MKIVKNMAIALVAIVAISSLNAAEPTRQRKATPKSGQGRKPAKRQSAADKEQDEYIISTMQLSCTLYEGKMYKALSDRGYTADNLCKIIDEIVRGNEIIQQATKMTKEFPHELDRLSPIFANVIADYFSSRVNKAKKDAIRACVNKSIATIKTQIKQGRLRLPEMHY